MRDEQDQVVAGPELPRQVWPSRRPAAVATTRTRRRETVIRFAFAPDPVWDLMNDAGVIEEWEKENGVTIETSTTWDEFTYFAGGHGDIVSMSTQETPVLEAETDIKTVTFGKYNYQRVPMLPPRRRPLRDPRRHAPGLEDLRVGSDVQHRRSGPSRRWRCTASTTGSAAATSSSWSTTTSSTRRTSCAATARRRRSSPRPPYRSCARASSRSCTTASCPSSSTTSSRPTRRQLHVLGNNFIATDEWFDENEDLAVKFLELWQPGIDMWKDTRPRRSRSTRSTSRSRAGGHRLHDRVRQRRPRLVRRQRPSSRATTGSPPRPPSGTS